MAGAQNPYEQKWLMEHARTFSTSMTTGTTATTRRSTAPVSHVVQPRLEPPATTNFFTDVLPPCSLANRAVTVSIARTALLTIAKRGIQVGSPVSMYLIQQ